MAKRKRTGNVDKGSAASVAPVPAKKVKQNTPSNSSKSTTIQIITGSYDRVLHGITTTISSENDVQFADTFLFNAHTSAIRALALSPPSAPVPKQSQKIILATGSTDERINLYHISAHPPSKISVPVIPSLTSKAVVENPQNRELGSLLHHSSSVTALYFPTRSKLMSAAEDSTIAVTRTRDWSLLSTIKAPIPKPIGRPSGDTAPLGGQPSGINDFAVHPSMKLMISVGKGEKCMRLWNLVTGKKAGVLSFERDMLNEVGEGRFSSGEGRRVAWGSNGDGGEEFCVAFERGLLIFGMDLGTEDDAQVLAVSTEDGRILFYSTEPADLEATKATEGKSQPISSAKLIAQLGGKDTGITGRIKDFSVLYIGEDSAKDLLIVTGSSDGAVRIWKLSAKKDLSGGEDKVKQAGKLIGTYETSNRITCLKAFVMIPTPEGVEDEDIEIAEGEDEEEDGDSDSDSDSDDSE
ncbi:Protein mak11 [Clarireedia jacksonii]